MKILITFTKHPDRLVGTERSLPMIFLTFSALEWSGLNAGTSMVRISNSLATGLKITGVRPDEQVPVSRRSSDVYTMSKQGDNKSMRLPGNFIGWPNRPTTPSAGLELSTMFANGIRELILRPLRKDDFTWHSDFTHMRKLTRTAQQPHPRHTPPAAAGVDLTELTHAVQAVNRALANRPEMIAAMEGRVLKLIMEIG